MSARTAADTCIKMMFDCPILLLDTFVVSCFINYYFFKLPDIKEY